MSTELAQVMDAVNQLGTQVSNVNDQVNEMRKEVESMKENNVAVEVKDNEVNVVVETAKIHGSNVWACTKAAAVAVADMGLAVVDMAVSIPLSFYRDDVVAPTFNVVATQAEISARLDDLQERLAAYRATKAEQA